MKRTLIIGGRNISINTLGDPIDIAFDRFYAAYLGQSPLPWDDIEEAAAEFFDRTVGNWCMHDDYFDNFTPIWLPLLEERRYKQAEDTSTTAGRRCFNSSSSSSF